MIENPKVGQRVWWLDLEDGCSTVESGRIADIPEPRELVWVRDRYGDEDDKLTSQLYGSPQSAAAALRAEAQRLNALADSLDEAAEHDAEIEANRIADREAMGDELESEASE